MSEQTLSSALQSTTQPLAGPPGATLAQSPRPIRGRGAARVGRLLALLLSLSAIWWLLSDGAAQSWVLGAPTVLAAGWVADRMGTGAGLRLSLIGLLGFVPLFLWESLRGGVDVALRILGRRVRVDPGFLRYHTGLPEAGARVFMVSCVSLLPGTLAAELEGEWLTIHTLSVAADNESGLRRLEHAIARLFLQGPQQPR